MSRSRNRRKNNPPKQTVKQGQIISRSQAESVLLSALDGYSNAAAFLGEDSTLISAGTFIRTGITANPELLTTTYRVSWLAKRIIDMPSEDMTRAWYSLSTSLPQDDLNDLRHLEARHSVKQEITNAIRWGRLYGGSIAVIVIRGEEDRLDQSLDYDLLLPTAFRDCWSWIVLRVLSRPWSWCPIWTILTSACLCTIQSIWIWKK